jgi:galactokinase
VTSVEGTAPGRLDLLGGVADYSGSLVLEVATHLATTVTAETDTALVVGDVALSTGDVAELAALTYPEIRAALVELPTWTRYLIGVAVVLVRQGLIDPPKVRLHVVSDIPRSVGIASSAALEVATARALVGNAVEPLRLAALCQEAENHVVGAPCGIMDQVAVAIGFPGMVLPIVCRPASVLAPLPLPAGVEVVGCLTGVAHDVGGVPYERARVAAFMGKRIIEDLAGQSWPWVSDLPRHCVHDLPEDLDGAVFLDRWGLIGDGVTEVDPTTTYPVRASTGFGVKENARAHLVMSELQRGRMDHIGSMMAASHASYDAMGLGHTAATALVEEVVSRRGVYGARSSGGGCGGTVVVLCEQGALDDIEGVIR